MKKLLATNTLAEFVKKCHCQSKLECLSPTKLSSLSNISIQTYTQVDSYFSHKYGINTLAYFDSLAMAGEKSFITSVFESQKGPTEGAITLSITSLSITTISIIFLIAILSIIDIKEKRYWHNNNKHFIMLNFCYLMCHIFFKLY
jgi:hypothetical protein